MRTAEQLQRHREANRRYYRSHKEKVLAYSKKRYQEHRDEIRLQQKAYYMSDPINRRNVSRRYGWKHKHGIVFTDAEYNDMLSKQGGVCAICGASPKTKRLNVDHDHATGKVRGLLCHRCNRYLLPSFEKYRSKLALYVSGEHRDHTVWHEGCALCG